MNENPKKNKNSGKKGASKNKNSTAKNAVENLVSSNFSAKNKPVSKAKYDKQGKVKNNSNKKDTKKSSKPKKNNKPASKPQKKQLPIKIIPLGGLGEIGKNITLYEYDGDMILVDCGMSFRLMSLKILMR